MRFVFVLVVLVNLGLLAWGQGFFGVPPAEQGRELRLLSERNEQAVVIGRAATQLRTP